MSLTNPPVNANVHENWLVAFTAENNTCLEFDGSNDHITFGNQLDTYTSFTLEAWIKPDSVSGSNDEFIIWRGNQDINGTTLANNVSWSLYRRGTGVGYFYQYGAGSDVKLTNTGSHLAANTWAHLAVVRDNADDTVKMYVNGALISTSTGTTDPGGGSDGNIFIGTATYSLSNPYFDGEIAHVRVWNVARTGLDIASTYLNVVDSDMSGLVGYWKLNEGSGSTVNDFSTNSHSGTLQNSPTWSKNGFDKFLHGFGLSFQDTVVDGQQFYGAINSSSSLTIRDSIDLTKGVAQSSSISLTASNINLLGAELYQKVFKGASNYLNGEVRVYASYHYETTLSDCQQLFTGRLVDVQVNTHKMLTFAIHSKRPWDRVTFPQTQSQNGIYQPVVYGDYTANPVGNVFVRDFNNHLHPVPFKSRGITSDHLVITPLASSNWSPHYYDQTADAFLPIDSGSYTAATKDLDDTYDANVNIGLVNRSLRRKFKLNANSTSSDGTSDLTDAKNLILQTYNSLGATHDYTGVSLDIKNFYGNFGCELGKINDIDMELKALITTPGGNAHNLNLTVQIEVRGSSYQYYASTISAGHTQTNITDSSFTSDAVHSVTAPTDYIKMNLSDTDNNISAITLQTRMSSAGAGSVSGTLAIRDFCLYVDVEHSYDETKAATDNSIRAISDTEYLYSGSDGLTASWDSDAIVYGHDAHRDLLQRFCDIPSTDPDNWTTLNNDRTSANWKIRYWEVEPTDLKQALDKLAYEFGFVAKYTKTGSLKYIHILQASEYTTMKNNGEVMNLTSDDITSVTLRNTPLSELITTMNISNKLHPAKRGTYYATTTGQNTANRAKYSQMPKEGVVDIELNANVGEINTTPHASDPSNDFYSYYNQIVGDLKVVISCDICNLMKGSKLETGDIITFSDMPLEMFGTDFSSTNYYMITETKRSVGRMRITAREVT